MKKQETLLILGGDGYLGWTLGLAFANRTDYKVVLADNLIKREWEKEVDAKLLVPFKSPKQRIAEFEKTFNKKNLSFEKVELLDQDACVKLLKKHKPFAIINAAQQPSAPFSMMSPKNSAATFSNNLVGHLNVLWAIAQVDKDIKYIKLGSAGCYMDVDTDFLPLGKKDYTFEHEGKVRNILNAWFPMQATDFYHQSKISDFLINDLCASVWKLKILTIQQSTIFGATIDENHAPERHGLSTRFNYDAVFSTVLNRFVCQLAIGHPLTVYGDGSQKTGLISLNDTVQNFFAFVDEKMAPGEHKVVHNFTHRLSIKDMAELLTKLAGGVEVKYMENPRMEGSGQLSKQVEVHKSIAPVHKNKDAKLEAELKGLLEFTQRYKDNIDPRIILPKIKWDDACSKKFKQAKAKKKKTNKIFFNYGVVGPLGASAYKAATSFLEEYFRVGPPDILLKYEPYVDKLAREAAKLLNCDESEITYIKNTTEGINLAADSLPLNRGDEVLISSGEYPANLLVWQKKKKEGIDVKFIDAAGSKEAFEAMVKAISPKTKAIAIAWAQHYDGYMADLKYLSDICQKQGIFLIVDAVQGIGVRALDLKKTPVDFLLCGGQKYLGGIVGIGFMYVNQRLMGCLRDTKVGIRSMQRFTHTNYVIKDTARRFEDGTLNLLGIVALHAALKRVNETGINVIEQKNLRLLCAFKSHLINEKISFIDHERQSNIIALPVDDAIGLVEYLREHKMYIKAFKNTARISFSHTSSLSDFKILVAKIKDWMAGQPVKSPIAELGGVSSLESK